MVGLLNAQSKKEQIEILNKRVDSLKEIVGSERKINLDKSTKISELTNTITNLESSISSLNTDVSKLTSQLQQSKTESVTKAQEISKLQAQLKTKTDSLTLVLNELEKLKPALKPVVVTNDKNSNSTNQVTQTGSIKSVKIGTQIWTSENLNISTFRNADPIPEARTDEEWKKAGEEGKPAWCYYDNDPKNGTKYGRLYNWYAVNDPRGLAPEGWHVPSEEEWKTLENYLGVDPGKKMKSTSGWNIQEEDIICSNCENWNAEYRRKTACHVCKDTRVSGIKTYSGNGTNSSGFSGLPGGNIWKSKFHHIGEIGFWWSSNEDLFNCAKSYRLDNINKTLMGIHLVDSGLSVRCIKD
jgi:uncharacterized protein (TIGR02145 family)